ncbi:uncharacterized protein [Dendrobates tinctorius]|uniref:uncharacterized protein isoform X2 n=1 Tax=Dendrobates tinctorius TaxID=92724 RepID=UPI003CC92D2C
MVTCQVQNDADDTAAGAFSRHSPVFSPGEGGPVCVTQDLAPDPPCSIRRRTIPPDSRSPGRGVETVSMIPPTLHLCVLISVIGISSSADPIQVISGVFMPNNISVDYDGAKVACAAHYSRLATLENITVAFTKGYEFCKWGWIEERRLVMLRLTPFKACSDYNVGILIRDCPNIRSTFCVNSTSGMIQILPIPTSLVPSYENANKTCTGSGLTIATKEEMEENKGLITNSSLAWYNWGVGKVSGGNFEQNSCDDTISQGSAFCYNPALSDVLVTKDNRTWKKIAIGCIIAFIFVVLLLTAAFMRGNKCICCMGEKRTHAPETTQAPVPTWNTTSIYRRISHASKDVIYDNVVKPAKGLPAIQPDLSFYKTHYSNMGFDNIGEV